MSAVSESRILAVVIGLLLLLVLGLALAAPSRGETVYGFDLSNARIPVEEIVRGGPARDAIPALDDPEAVPASQAPWSDEELVIGVVVGARARAYPISILIWHELVNDELGGRPILVSYCPLCGTAITFDRRIDGREHRFGVSGLLFESDLLMFDRESGSLWSQISAEAVAGPRAGRRLTLLRSEVQTFGHWKREQPQTTVLIPDTGHERPYGRTPYAGYDTSTQLAFPVRRLDRRYHPKMPTVGLRVPGGEARGYPSVELERAGGRVAERFAGFAVRVAWDPVAGVFDVTAPEDVEVIRGFWFAWAAFHPQTSVFRSQAPQRNEVP